MNLGIQPAHYGIEPLSTSYPEDMQMQWLWDFDFMTGENWDDKPLDWYITQLGDA